MQAPLKLLALLFILSLSSCSSAYYAYIRNMTGETATIDVFLLDKKFMKTLPNRVCVANKILDFKSGYRNHIDIAQNVVWKDMNHFKLEVKPKVTIDLTDIAGVF